jgi:adenosylcobinamide-GDP ribazoletransferase
VRADGTSPASPGRGRNLAWRGMRAAMAFLTCVPSGGHPFNEAELTWAPAFFPLVGLLLGAALAVLHLALWPLGPRVDAVFVVGASLWLTGALHEDGLADTCDALGGAHDRERALEILNDSRVGVFGACALVISIVGRIALLDRLGRDCLWALPLVGCAARVGPVWQMVLVPYVSHAGSTTGALARARGAQASVATGWLGAVGGASILLRFVSVGTMAALLAALVLVVGVTSWRYAARLGGVTGDLLGATQQVGELAVLAVLAWGRG